jgi:hypothetical protein
MVLKQLTALAFVLLLFGCLAQPYSGAKGQPPSQQPATQQPPAQPPQAPTLPVPAQNQSAPPAENVSPPAPSAPPANVTPPPPPAAPQPPSETTKLSAADLLNQKLNKLPYPSGGPYNVRTYQWVSNEFNTNTTDITINPTMQVLFDNKTETNLVAFGFTTYAPLGGVNRTSASGIAIVYNESVSLDARASSGISFEIEYNVPGFVRTMNGVRVVSKETVVDAMNRTLSIYDFDADRVTPGG